MNYSVQFVGMDGRDHENCFGDLPSAKNAAVDAENNGAQCVCLFDEDGVDISFSDIH
jgi:hypothetical protein